MALFYNLRLKAGRMILQRRISAQQRIRTGFGLDKVKRVALLWDSTDENDYKHLSQLSRHFTDSGKSVDMIVWIPGSTVPDRLGGHSHMTFLKKSDLNWAFIPVSADARKFLDTAYDLIIDINPSSLFQLSSLAALSAAPMKVGPDPGDEAEKSPYDLMIKMPEPFNIGNYLDQVLHYLARLSTTE